MWSSTSVSFVNNVIVPFTTNTVVSAGANRALSGGTTEGGIAPKSAMVAGRGLFRSTKAASGSVPVLTDQRSTPQVGLCTVRVMGAVAVRPSASVMVATRFLTPVGMNGPMVYWKVNTLSPAV